MLIRILKILVNLLRVVAPIAVAAGLLLNLCLKNDKFKNFILPFYPRYVLAHNGIKTLEDIRFPAKETKDKEINVGVLNIENPSWEVMLDFLQSETAFRKSERNEPVKINFSSSDASTESPEKDTDKSLVSINWDRIKTIISVRVDVMKAGTKPLVAPYRLVVIWPPTARRVYEFLSFQEFRLDMNKVLVAELEYYAVLMSIVAFIAGLFLAGVRRFILAKYDRSQESNSLQPKSKAEAPNEALSADS